MCVEGGERKTPLGCAYLGNLAQCAAQPPDLNSQARTMRLIVELQSEYAGDEPFSRDVFGPALRECPREREQHRALREQDIPNGITTGIDNQGSRPEQCFHFLQSQQ